MREDDAPVRSAMTSRAVSIHHGATDARDPSVTEDTPIALAAERMRRARVRALVVTSASRPGLVVGIVTDLDLLRWVAQSRRAA